LDILKPCSTAFLGSIYVGTDRLGRPLTDAEKKDLSSLLRKHDFVGASIVSLRFAFTLRRRMAAAQDLQGRANLRLVRVGWDPREIPLVKRLCRLVWSEHTHETRESAAARKAEEVFLREQGIHNGTAASAEDLATRLEAERQDEELAAKRIASLRAAFVQADDTINQLWLDYRLAGVHEPSEMARLSGHDVGAFYRAADRRKRLTARLLAAESGAKPEEKK
jgi:hypothetical protein